MDVDEHLRVHLADGQWHDDCPYCVRRREQSGTGVTDADLLQHYGSRVASQLADSPLVAPDAGKLAELGRWQQHVVTLEGPDLAGHWGWDCTKQGCREDASGYEPREVLEAALVHGALAADSPLPPADDEES